MWVVGQTVVTEFEPELGLGTVSALIGARMIEVSFPSAGLTRRYTAQAAPLRRLILGSGQRVRTRDGKNHIIANGDEVAGLFIYETETGLTLKESDLEQVVEDETPVSRFLLGQWKHPRSFPIREAAWKLRAKSQDPQLRGLVGPRVSLLPHQLYIASEVARREFPRVLLADEVGLGKTIESGMIFSSLRALGRADRVLILVPEALEHQWLAEMFRRFQEMFSVVDESRSEQEDLSQGQSAFEMNQRIICSLPFLEENAERLQQAADEDWDLLIVDEAHRLMWSPESPSIQWEIVRLLSRKSRGLLLLTATPERQGIQTQFGLLHLVDPLRFPDFAQFEKQNLQMRSVAALASQLQAGVKTPEFIKELKQRFSADKEVVIAIDRYKKDGDSGELLHQLVDRHGTGRVFIRNRRNRIAGFPERKFLPIPLSPPPEWLEYVQALKPEALTDAELMSISAGIEATGKKTARLHWLHQRATAVLDLINRNKEEKFLLICSTGKRVQELQVWLRNMSPVRTAVFHEEMEVVERDRQAAWFGQPDGARVLLCSEIGGEGRNFQFCQNLILFDLPAHPDSLEQRIGRLDRFGQAKAVKTHVPYFTDTPEEVLLDWYSQALEVFTRPWNGGALAEKIVASLYETARAFLPQSKQHKNRRELLTQFIQAARIEVEALRTRQQQSQDVLIDLNSFDEPRGLELAKRITAVDKDPELKEFLEKAFDYFGIDSERLDELGTIKLTAHSLTFVENFPGLTGSGDLSATYDRALALSREELSFLTWEHPITQGALTLTLEGDTGRISAGVWRNSGCEEHVLVELLYILQPIAPADLEVEQDLQLQLLKIFVSIDGEPMETPAGLESANLQPVPPPVVAELMKGVRSRLPRAVQAASARIAKVAGPLVTDALTRRTARFDREQARLEHLARINPLVSNLELEAHAEKKQAGLEAIKLATPRLDAIRLILMPPG